MSRALTPRQQRALALLKTGQWVAREAIDNTAGASNGPGTIAQLRNRFGRDAIDTRMVPRVDRDGKFVLAGEYRLSDRGVERLVGMAQLEAANDEQL
jgi:hypothetical protein